MRLRVCERICVRMSVRVRVRRRRGVRDVENVALMWRMVLCIGDALRRGRRWCCINTHSLRRRSVRRRQHGFGSGIMHTDATAWHGYGANVNITTLGNDVNTSPTTHARRVG